ncbi:MAG: DMT family transporter [Megasphaera sp.]|jgi:drug/metabolite transporter (DMT)-like permease|nr:DMT family transporter [Megasphaera sp.]MCI1247399.1 DMT family transporter [Megasphaera sp.]
MPQSEETKAKLALLSAMLIFGTIGIFVRYIPLPSSIIALARSSVATIFLFILLAVRHQPICFSAIRQNMCCLFASGLMLGLNWILLFEAYRYTTVAVATVCYYMAPSIVMIAAPFILHERLTLRKGICVITALAGIILISGVGQNSGTGDLTGILCGLGAACFYAGIILLNKKLSGLTAYDRTIVQLGIAAILLIPYTLCTEDFTALAIAPIVLILLAVIGIVHTGIAYVLYFGSIPYLKAQTVAIFSYTDPIFAILLSALFLQEPLGLISICGAVLVLGSTFISEIKS